MKELEQFGSQLVEHLGDGVDEARLASQRLAIIQAAVEHTRTGRRRAWMAAGAVAAACCAVVIALLVPRHAVERKIHFWIGDATTASGEGGALGGSSG